MRLQHIDVGEVRECGLVSDHPREPDLIAMMKQAEASRVLDSSPDDFKRNTW
jgi:hypothetical protein